LEGGLDDEPDGSMFTVQCAAHTLK